MTMTLEPLTAAEEATELSEYPFQESLAPLTENNSGETDEIIPLCFLIPEEEYADEEDTGAFLPVSGGIAAISTPISSTRSRRRQKEETLSPEISARRDKMRFRARLVTWGLELFMLVFCVIAGTYKIPLLIGKSKPYPPALWIYEAIWGTYKAVESEVEEVKKEIGYKTRQGDVLEEKYVKDLLKRASEATPVGKKLFTDAKELYRQSQDEEEPRKKISAILMAEDAAEKMGAIVEELRRNEGTEIINARIESSGKIDDDIRLYLSQWRKTLTMPEMKLYEEMKKQAASGGAESALANEWDAGTGAEKKTDAAKNTEKKDAETNDIDW
jgi:hypothetical protein